MSELIEYFTRHYTLVLDNDQSAYYAVQSAAREAITSEAPELTLSEYRAMSAEKRAIEFASAIGDGVLALIDEWTQEVIEASDGSAGALLITEVLITDGSELAYALGEYYMPEDGDADEFLTDDDDDDN